ncbi:efflux RND transporter periplasmic adaptor subunit [Phenylobacterium immobile]|uniref:efflux RND transporter periplasmic adaptor subunit n=1 Tax=Phenylobacterium immobile TaxID=21 RepID=UPI000AFECF9A|nr:efflux RND transporter periplasmic adaptor subunit [Phenylobacterium immobile]
MLSACGPKGGAQGPQGPMPVSVVVMQAQPAILTTELTGRTSALEVSEVRPQVTGVVRARLFTEGGQVKKGQALYQIDPATYQATLQSAQAGLAQAQASLSAARLKAERYRGLVAMNAVSKQDNDDAQAAFRQAQANVQAQQATVRQGQIGVEFTRVLSPISGRIGKSSVTPGALVTATQATPLATVQNLDKIYVDLTQSAAEVMRLRREFASGQVGRPTSTAVSLILEDGVVYPVQGQLEFSDVSVDPGTGSVTLRAIFPNASGELLPGLFVRARLTKAVAADALLVPQGVVSRGPKGEATVMVVGAGDKVEPRNVMLGQGVGSSWLVLSGLKAGDRLIVDNLQKLQPGMPVKPTPVQPGQGSAAPAAAPQTAR